MSNKTKEEILKECTEGLLKCSVTYNMSHKGILQAMNVYSNQCQEALTTRILELEAQIEYYKKASQGITGILTLKNRI